MREPVVISGIGQSDVGRRLGRDGLDLTLDACLDAIADAGLDRSQIDGAVTYPGANLAPGILAATIEDVQDALRLDLDWFGGVTETSGGLGALATGCAAIAAGYATHVLCYRSLTESTAMAEARHRTGSNTGPDTVSDYRQWTDVFGAPSVTMWMALNAARYFHEYGTTREQLAQIALNDRRNAALNPRAVYQDPLTLDDYLAARMISTPLCLFDCDVPVDGAVAVILSRADAVPDRARPPIVVEGVGTAIHGRPVWFEWDDLTTMAMRDAATMMWSRTDLGPADVDLAQVYDGFSILTLMWLEALGFCGRGEAGPFVEGGTRIAREGELPLNSCGGQLSAGRLHGFGLLHEACVQLRGDGAARQLASIPRIAVVAVGGGSHCASVLLRQA
jgi:acetyl-CoA acetyltransferase